MALALGIGLTIIAFAINPEVVGALIIDHPYTTFALGLILLASGGLRITIRASE